MIEMAFYERKKEVERGGKRWDYCRRVKAHLLDYESSLRKRKKDGSEGQGRVKGGRWKGVEWGCRRARRG